MWWVRPGAGEEKRVEGGGRQASKQAGTFPPWVVYMAGRPNGGPHCTCASQPMYLAHLPPSPLSPSPSLSLSRLPVLGNTGRQTNKVNNITFSFLVLLTPPGMYGVGGQVLAGKAIELDYTCWLDGRQAGRQDSFFALFCTPDPIPFLCIPLLC